MPEHKPLLYDLFCGAGGAAKGYMDVGFRVVGVDSREMPRYVGDGFIEMDVFEFFRHYMAGEHEEADAFHASPPCQAYTIIHNLPWLRNREYPSLILPTLDMLKAIGKPFALENVMGARYGAKGLTRRGLKDHGLQAGWLCGGMFGLPFYRHRLFATSFFWLAPGHPTHKARIRSGHSLAGRARDIVFSDAEDARGKESWPNQRPYNRGLGGVLSLTPPNANVHQSFSVRAASRTLAKWQNGAQAEGVGLGHAKGWRMAAEAMGIDWMKREELTQAIPPVYTRYIGAHLLTAVRGQQERHA